MKLTKIRAPIFLAAGIAPCCTSFSIIRVGTTIPRCDKMESRLDMFFADEAEPEPPKNVATEAAVKAAEEEEKAGAEAAAAEQAAAEKAAEKAAAEKEAAEKAAAEAAAAEKAAAEKEAAAKKEAAEKAAAEKAATEKAAAEEAAAAEKAAAEKAAAEEAAAAEKAAEEKAAAEEAAVEAAAAEKAAAEKAAAEEAAAEAAAAEKAAAEKAAVEEAAAEAAAAEKAAADAAAAEKAAAEKAVAEQAAAAEKAVAVAEAAAAEKAAAEKAMAEEEHVKSALNIELVSSNDDRFLNTIGSFLVDAFWLNSPHHQLGISAENVDEGVRLKLIVDQASDLQDKYGEVMGRRTLQSSVIAAVDTDKQELVGCVTLKSTLLYKGEFILEATYAELELKNSVASLRPKERRQYNRASASTIASELMGNNMKAIVVLSNLAVSPSARNQGVAQVLCNEAEAIAKSWGYDELYLLVEEENQSARNLYENKLGYEYKFTRKDEAALRANLETGEFSQTTADTLGLVKKI